LYSVGQLYPEENSENFPLHVPRKIEEFQGKTIKSITCGDTSAAVILGILLLVTRYSLISETSIGLETDLIKWVDNQSLSDVTFIVGERRIFGHKVIIRYYR
jgi:hypothetical protein